MPKERENCSYQQRVYPWLIFIHINLHYSKYLHKHLNQLSPVNSKQTQNSMPSQQSSKQRHTQQPVSDLEMRHSHILQDELIKRCFFMHIDLCATREGRLLFNFIQPLFPQTPCSASFLLSRIYDPKKIRTSAHSTVERCEPTEANVLNELSFLCSFIFLDFFRYAKNNPLTFQYLWKQMVRAENFI